MDEIKIRMWRVFLESSLLLSMLAPMGGVELCL